MIGACTFALMFDGAVSRGQLDGVGSTPQRY